MKKNILMLFLLLALLLAACQNKGESYEKSATIIINCGTVLNNMDMLKEEKKELIPEDGIIFINENAGFNDGESVLDLFLRQMQENKMQYEYAEAKAFDTVYVEAVQNLYSLDCGEQSGWLFRINGEFPTEGCNKIKLNDKDVIEFLYTCDWGADVGAFEQ